MSATLNRWVLLVVLLVSVVGAASPVLGSATAPSACCCDAGACHCPDSGMDWIPTCCASDDTVPEPVAAANPSTQIPSDSAHRSGTVGFAAPPVETRGISTIANAGESAPPGVTLFTLHASLLI